LAQAVLLKLSICDLSARSSLNFIVVLDILGILIGLPHH